MASDIASSFEHSLSTLEEIVSGPVSLEMFSLSSNLRTSGDGKWMKDTSGVDDVAVVEAALPGGRVCRDCICWQNMRRGNLVK